MANMKTMMAFLVDVGTSMGDPLHPGGCTKIVTASTLIASHMTQRIMASKTVEFSVVTYGSETTSNFLHSTEADGGYENVEEVMAMGTKTLDNIGDVYNISVGGEGTNDIIDGVAVAQDLLIRCNAGKKYNRVLVLVTDGESEIDPHGIEHLQVCVEKMRADGFILYTLLLGASRSPSPTYIENLKLLQQISAHAGTGGLKQVRHLGDALCYLSAGPGLSTKPQLLKNQLHISPSIPSVPVVLWNRVMKQTNPSLKKQSVRSFDPLAPGSGAVKRDTSHRDPDDPDEIIQPEHKVKGYKYGREFVPVNAADEDMIKLPSLAGVTIITFLPFTAIPRQYFMSAAVSMEPQPENEGSTQALAALGKVLCATNQVGLVRVVKKDDTEPFLGALIPTSGAAFCIQRLPFSEDVRDYAFPPLNGYRLGTKRARLEPLVSGFVDAMTYSKVTANSLVTFNPVYQSIIHRVQRIQFGDDVKMAPVPDIVLVKTPAAANSIIQQLVGQISEVCSLEALERREKKRKVYWDEIKVKVEEAGGDNSEGTAGAISRSTSVSSIDSDVANLRQLLISSQSGADVAGAQSSGYRYRVISRDNATNPAETLLELLQGNTPENVAASVDIMQGVILDLITMGATGAHYKKAIQCVKSMRAAVVHLATITAVTSFHSYLQTLKEQFKAGRHCKFWEMFVQEYSSTGEYVYVTQSDCKHSPIPDGTPADVNGRLFAEEVAASHSLAPPTQLEEEDDMFGDMM
jgi:hypothetical protein